MSIAASARIHSTALLSPDCVIGENVQIGPYAVLEGRVTIGPDCVIRPHAHLVGELVMGQGNDIGKGVSIGDRPQHTGHKGAPTRVLIGDRNVFREGVTVHGSFVEGGVTRIGDDNFLMVNSHVAHDCTLGNNIILVNGALVAGHATLHDRVTMSGNSALHQFGMAGKLAFISGGGLATKDVPPFAIVHGRSEFGGVNLVGMRRNGYSRADIDAVRKAYDIIYNQGLMLKLGLAKVAKELGHVDAVNDILEFIRSSKRGVPGAHLMGRSEGLSEAA